MPPLSCIPPSPRLTASSDLLELSIDVFDRPIWDPGEVFVEGFKQATPFPLTQATGSIRIFVDGFPDHFTLRHFEALGRLVQPLGGWLVEAEGHLDRCHNMAIIP